MIVDLPFQAIITFVGKLLHSLIQLFDSGYYGKDILLRSNHELSKIPDVGFVDKGLLLLFKPRN